MSYKDPLEYKKWHRRWSKRLDVRARKAAHEKAYRLAHPDRISRAKLKKRRQKTKRRAHLLRAQGGRCAICGKKPSRWHRIWHVDHNHITREVRGVLCMQCNTGLGLFKDSPKLLDKAKRYLLQ